MSQPIINNTHRIVRLDSKTYSVFSLSTKKVSHIISKRHINHTDDAGCKTMYHLVQAETGKEITKGESLQDIKQYLRIVFNAPHECTCHTRQRQSYNHYSSEANDALHEELPPSFEIAPPVKPTKSKRIRSLCDGGEAIKTETSSKLFEEYSKRTRSTKADITDEEWNELLDVLRKEAEDYQCKSDETWKTFFTRHLTGRRFPRQSQIHQYVGVLGKIWVAKKSSLKFGVPQERLLKPDPVPVPEVVQDDHQDEIHASAYFPI